MIKKCSVEGCDRQVRTKGLCKKHNAVFLRTGSPISLRPWKKHNKIKLCSVNGCERETVAKGLCIIHYSKQTNAKEEVKEKDRIRKRVYQKTEKGKQDVLKRQQKRRARKRGVEVESVSPKDIYERDNWTCYLCGKKINKTSKAPHPKSPSLDHVVPICKGGSHTYDNLKAAHLYCNQSKGGKTLEEYRKYCEQRQGPQAGEYYNGGVRSRRLHTFWNA